MRWIHGSANLKPRSSIWNGNAKPTIPPTSHAAARSSSSIMMAPSELNADTFALRTNSLKLRAKKVAIHRGRGTPTVTPPKRASRERGSKGLATKKMKTRPLSDTLVRDLTAHRTLGLRLNLAEQPEVATIAATHALAAQIFHLGADAHIVGIQLIKTDLAAHADGIEDTPCGKAWADRHANWARQIPRDVTELWAFVAELDHDSRLALFAHCVALTVNAVRLPWHRRPRAILTADRLAEAVSLDMTAYWRPTVRSYLGRVTKARILEAMREGQPRGGRSDGRHEEGRHGGSGRAVAGPNGLATGVAGNEQTGRRTARR